MPRVWGGCVKRRAIKLVRFLFAGAIINVAVAWGCALWHSEERVRLSKDEIRLALGLSENDLPAMYTGTVGYGRAAARRFAWAEDAPNTRRWIDEVWSGFPTYAMTARTEFVATPNGETFTRTWAIQLPADLSTQFNTLPLRPIWPGFAINTIFYAAVLWVLFAIGGVPVKVRRWRRIKRGVCVRCAYPVGASDVCSECGTRVTAVHGASPPATPA
jgi:hypothetical protein